MTNLVHLYGNSKDTDELTRDQFEFMLQDIYRGLDGDKQLTNDQLKNIMYLVDADGNGEVSIEELVRIAADNEPKKVKAMTMKEKIKEKIKKAKNEMADEKSIIDNIK